MFEFPIFNNSTYTSRPLLESKILKVYESRRNASDSYTVIVGPKGAGKTSAVAHVLSKKPGVRHVDVSEADTEKTILLKLLKIKDAALDVFVGLSVLQPFLVHIAERFDGRRITIVLEVERGSKSDEILHMVKSTAKKLALAANVIIILSEANAVLAFGGDRRQKFIWVEGMTHEEAMSYARKVFPTVTDDDLEFFFDRVGTLPLDIRDFCEAMESGENAADYIETTLRAAEEDLAGFTHQPILKALKSSPDGVKTYKFRGVKYEGVNLANKKEVAAAMKSSEAIVYHFPSKEYRLASRAHRTVLVEEYDPLV
jgi:hypothetical protein